MNLTINNVLLEYSVGDKVNRDPRKQISAHGISHPSHANSKPTPGLQKSQVNVTTKAVAPALGNSLLGLVGGLIRKNRKFEEKKPGRLFIVQ